MGVKLRQAATAAIAICTASVASGAQAQKMPPGSYLRKPVTTGTEIASQIKSDPLVAERYSRIYKLSPDTISKAVSGMKLTKLKQDRVLRVYYVHKGEKLGYKVRRVPKGTPIFEASDGTPTFVKACGNPIKADFGTGLTAALPGAKVHKYTPAEPVAASSSSLDVSAVSAPIVDEEGRVILEGTSLNLADGTPTHSVFVEETEAASHTVSVSAPKGEEDTYFLDWYRVSANRTAMIAPHSPSIPGGTTVAGGGTTVAGGGTTTGYASSGGSTTIPGGGTTSGYSYSGGSTWGGVLGVPSGPSGPFIPVGGSSMGAAHTPEPGAAAMLVGAVLGGGMLLRRRRKA